MDHSKKELKFKVSYRGLYIDIYCKHCKKTLPAKISKELKKDNFISLIGECSYCNEEVRTIRTKSIYAIPLSCGEGFILDIPEY